jgi:hypothetical protein
MSYVSTVLADLPKGYYRLDELSGAIANDISGNNNTATISGATYSQVGAIVNDTDTCMLFASGGGVTLPYTLGMSGWTAASVEFWIKLDANWHHVVITATLYYLDGVLTDPGSGGELLVNDTLSFAGSFTLSGYIDELAVYNKLLSATQVANHYSASLQIPAQATGPYSNAILADKATAYYRLNESGGSTAFDSSGNNYNGVLSGATYQEPGALASENDPSILFSAGGGLLLPATLDFATWQAASLEFWCNIDSNWHYIAETTNGTNTLRYVDAVQTTPGSGGSILLDGNFTFAGSYILSGELDEVALYNYVLTPAQISAHLAASKSTSTGGGGTTTGGGTTGGGSTFIPKNPYQVVVNGAQAFIIAGSLSIDSTIGRRGQAAFNVHSSTSTHYQQDQQVAVYDQNDVLAFSGYIANPKEQKPGFQKSLIHTVTCVDQHRLADKRRLAAVYTQKTIGFIVQDIVLKVLANEGVTIGSVYDGLAPSPNLWPSPDLFPSGNVGLIPQATFVYCKVSEALDALVKQASAAGIPYYWQIDQNKQLWFVPYTAIVNSNIIDGTKIDQINNPPTVQRKNDTYRNTQYVLGGVAQTVPQQETRVGDGNTTSWPMGYDLATTPTITVNSVAKVVAVKGSTGADFYWAQGDPVIAQDSNGTKLRGPSDPGGPDTLVVSYVGQYPTVIISQNNAQVAYEASLDGTSGIVEDVEQDNTITSADSGFSLASQLLTRYAVQGTLFQGSTLVSGYAPGQLVTVDLPDHGLNNAEMLIESVNASDQTDNLNIYYTINAVQGPYDTTWAAYWGALLKQPQQANAINIGISQSLAILASFNLSITPSLSLISSNAYSCPLPSNTLYPSNTLLPC